MNRKEFFDSTKPTELPAKDRVLIIAEAEEAVRLFDPGWE